MTIRFNKRTLAHAIALSCAAFSTSSATAEGLVLEEVIVTAQKRAEGLQDVPISINATSGEKIDD